MLGACQHSSAHFCLQYAGLGASSASLSWQGVLTSVLGSGVVPVGSLAGQVLPLLSQIQQCGSPSYLMTEVDAAQLGGSLTGPGGAQGGEGRSTFLDEGEGCWRFL